MHGPKAGSERALRRTRDRRVPRSYKGLSRERETRKSLVALAGEWLVMSELLRRGYHAHLPPSKWPGHDILVTTPGLQKVVRLEVKSVSGAPVTRAERFYKKDADVLVLVSHLRAKSSKEVTRLGPLGSLASPVCCVIPFDEAAGLVKKDNLYLERKAVHLYSNKWDSLGVTRERRRDVRRWLLGEAEQYFVAAHMSRCGFPTYLGVERGGRGGLATTSPGRNPRGGVCQTQCFFLVHPEQVIPEIGTLFYFSGEQSRDWFERKRPVAVPINILPYRGTVRLASLAEWPIKRSSIIPALFLGIIAFVHLRPEHDPFERFAVFDREFLRKAARKTRSWSMSSLVESYLDSRHSCPWAVRPALT